MSAVLATEAVSIGRESYAQLHADIVPLMVDHWREVALYQEEIALDPDFERYRRLEAVGNLVALGARRGCELIGYSVFILHKHLHYKDCLVASNDVLYVAPDERHGGTGIRLIRASERELAHLGVQRITWHVKPKNDFSALLKRMGYATEETIFGRLLGGGSNHYGV